MPCSRSPGGCLLLGGGGVCSRGCLVQEVSAPRGDCSRGGGCLLLEGCLLRGVWLGKLRGIRSRPTPKGGIEGIRSRPTPKGGIEGDQIQVPSPRSRLRHTVNERPVRILLECILVVLYCYFIVKSTEARSKIRLN